MPAKAGGKACLMAPKVRGALPTLSATPLKSLAILQPEDWATWLGETDTSPTGVKALLRTFEDGGNWTMAEQEPMMKARPQKEDPQQGLF